MSDTTDIFQIETLRQQFKRRGSLVISFTVQFETICTVPKKPYGGDILITYAPSFDKEGYATLLEWNSFARWVETLRSQMYLAEELAQLVADTVMIKVAPECVDVVVKVKSPFHLPVEIEVTIP